MTFEEILDQALAMVQRRGRVTYRTLKLQFALDDEQLATLKDELLYSQPQVIDDAERGLVWTGDTGAPPACAPWPPSSASSVLPPTQAVQGARRGADHAAPEAERRQLTVLFCDLVDSTKLSSQLDPEDYREVVRAYQWVCTEIIQRYDGHIAQLLGDGLLVYFGYPQAHEDDAQRAVRTGLGILAAMGDLNQSLQQAKGVQLAIRVGVHTGLVVVGEMGGQGRQEQLALGETPNIAARIQGLAVSNAVIISYASYRLVQGYFECQDLGAQALRGITESMHIYQVLSESGATSRLDVAQPRGLTPLVGRESEVTLLQERWAQAKSAQGQVILLTGDAGIGKSRLVQTLKDHVADEPHVRWECRSAEYYQNTAWFPLVDLFQRLLQLQAEDTPDEKVEKLAQALSHYQLPVEESVPLFAPLLALPIPEDRYPPLHLSPQRQRQKTLESLVAILLALAEQQPVLFILEDLHWTDPTTLELIGLLLDQTPTASMLVLLTCRPHFHPAWHHRSYLTELTLNRLSHTQVEQLVTRMTDGKTLPKEVIQQIIAKTDGVPLFVEELTKAILESGHLKESEGHYALTGSLATFAIPTTLHDSLMARLDRLVTAKAVAQYAAVIGRQFAYDVLLTVSQLDAATLQRELGRLVEVEMVYQRGVPPQATYLFKHALIQDAAYQSLLKSTRQHYHQRIAQALEAQFPETAATRPELLAHHYTEAGLRVQAIPYWQQAGEKAVERSANVEAISHLTKGLEVLYSLPATSERTQQELVLQTTLGPALMAAKGFAAPEVQQVYARARELCRQVEDTTQLFSVLWGLWLCYEVHGELRTAHELAEQLLDFAQRQHDATLFLQVHRAQGQTLLWLGEFTLARSHLAQGRVLYDPQQHHGHAFLYGQDPGVACRNFEAQVLWYLGYPDQALERIHEALALSRELSDPFSLAFTLASAAWLHQYHRAGRQTKEQAEASIALATEQGFPFFLAMGTVLRGWALTVQGQGEEGIAHMRQGLAAWQATGAEILRTFYLALLAEAHGSMGQTAEGLAALAEASALVEQRGECFYAAELHRLKGELLLQSGGYQSGAVTLRFAEAEACFQQALTLARRQEAKSLELRAAMSLSRLWQQQGKRDEARELLAPIYGWFTEGFDTADLQEAKTLLDALA